MRLGTNLMVLLNQMTPIYTPTFLKQNMQVHIHVHAFTFVKFLFLVKNFVKVVIFRISK